MENFMEIELLADSDSGYVIPKDDCEHLKDHVKIEKLTSIETKCEKCGIETDEIWVCLCCGKCLCGRFVNKCMVDHSMKEYHLVALSLADLSFWCYVCDCYIINTNPILKPIYNSAHLIKFKTPSPLE